MRLRHVAKLSCSVLLAAYVLWIGCAMAQTPPALDAEVLRVGTKSSPPFSFLNAQGQWTGAAIELWEAIAAKLDIRYEYHTDTTANLLTKMRENRLDALVMNLSTTAERERYIDFTHPYYVTGLGIAAAITSNPGFIEVARIFSLDFIRLVGALVGLSLVMGYLIYVIERRRQSEGFGQRGLKGIGTALWFGIMTMTGMNDGERTPMTLSGRILTVAWLFTGIVFMSFFTAYVTSSLTVQSISANVSGLNDLQNKQVGAVTGTTAERFLERSGITPVLVDQVEEGLMWLAEKRLDAVVFDKPVLQYLVQKNPKWNRKITVLPVTLQREDYALGFSRENSALRNQVNVEVIDAINSGLWQKLLDEYIQEN